MKYRLLVPLGQHAKGEVLETGSLGSLFYGVFKDNGVVQVYPHEILLMLKAGMLEEVKDKCYATVYCKKCGIDHTHLWAKPTLEDGSKPSVCTECGVLEEWEPKDLDVVYSFYGDGMVFESIYKYLASAYIDAHNIFRTSKAAESARDQVRTLLQSLPRG